MEGVEGRNTFYETFPTVTRLRLTNLSRRKQRVESLPVRARRHITSTMIMIVHSLLLVYLYEKDMLPKASLSFASAFSSLSLRSKAIKASFSNATIRSAL